MDTIKAQVPEQDHISVTIMPDGVKARLDVPEEVIKVTVDLIGQPGEGGGGGSGIDTIARQRAAEAKAAADAAQAALIAHRSAAAPHKAYDEDIQDLSLIFQNGLI